MKRHVCALSLALGAATAMADELAAARAEFAAATSEEAAGRLNSRVRSFERCPPGETNFRELLVTASGAPRVYSDRSGSDDAGLRRRHVYDEQGRLRAAQIDAAASNGTRLQVRLFFDPAGRSLLQAQRLIAGPGYTFPLHWSAADLVWQPDQALAASSDCEIEIPR